ncbi:MAG: hypothetical protein GKR94_15215 [Gammaproteobacteria bacterium]|nr:hypothetical protein [Gammaproteobacteria bacterium]
MYLNAQWSERSLVDDIQSLVMRIEAIGIPRDRKGKHTISFLKQMVRTKRDQLALLRHQLERGGAAN